ncbi:ABC transporter permease [Streptomyces sp. NBS 14/10]|uniref:ABC transporter permease n=1 Tax=Streptomyces sp. NBS 14/10 TaxID=1945643 RepID=UPI000B7FDF79|nr:ABC transporter permease [Streptomyces sp. NBS 14/10]KAK1185157.1 ABC transporter permease [Streptomyces sp. NBS 14/10]NUP41381.1 ABC transporter permease [Streptomyces sp.]NUS82438.1 ABC transporter permease [Streptomyces sp.]
MTLYVLRRLTAGLVLAVLVTMITFLLLSTSFDDVASSIVGNGATPARVQAQKAQLGLDRPLFTQYLDWLSHAIRGDLGLSYFTSEPVRSALAARLGVTLSIVLTALLVTTVISVVLGVLAATRGGAVDRIAQGVSMVGYLVPNLLIAIALVYVLAVKLHWFPATGYTPLAENPAGWASTIAIPVVALMMSGVAGLTSQIRGAMIGELRKDHIRTLRTRGIPTRSIVLRHALRGAAGPALTVLSLEFIQMLGGALIIEQVFALPGFGQYAFNASLQGDIPIIMGISLFGVLLVVCVNLVVDLVNGWLNPKARVLQ